MSYASPASGILCLELLKPTTVGQTVTRSSIIQQLSLLVGFLDWVGPSAPNSNLCKSVMEVIKRVLDQTLNSVGPTQSEAFAWNSDVSAELNDFFNFDLLDTFAWLRPDGDTDLGPQTLG